MPIPSRRQAEDFLADSARLNPGPWERHSRYVAQGAEILASHHPTLDPQRAYVLGLLHDIGRRAGIHDMRHIVDGFEFLSDQGFPGAARICLTHSFPVEGLVIGSSPWDGTQAELDFVEAYLGDISYDDYDRLIQLCDAIALPTGFCLMEKRFVDVVMRYGFNEMTLPRWRGFFNAKADMEAKIGRSIYELLPGVVQITFRDSST